MRFFVVDERRDDDVPASYNVAPTQPVRAVVEHEQRRFLVAFRWGLVPSWAGDPRIGSKMINARAETAADKPAFQRAFRRRRCIIPADGFYEWRRGEDGSRTPFYIHPTDAPVFAFAGLWETWRAGGDPDAAPLRTCVILTRSADERIAGLHSRMPVVLPRSRWDAWLDRGRRDAEAVQDLLADAGSGGLGWHEVSTDVNSVDHDRPDLIRPA